MLVQQFKIIQKYLKYVIFFILFFYFLHNI